LNAERLRLYSPYGVVAAFAIVRRQQRHRNEVVL
jgi:hypothetical protein